MDIDERLQRAGERWRSQQPVPPAVDLLWMTQRQPSHWPARLAAAGSGLVVTAIVIGLLVFRSGQTTNPAAQPTPLPADTFAAGVLHNGDGVRGVGRVVMAAGGLPRLCLTEPQPAVGYAPGQEPPPTCSAIAITLNRFDPAGVSSWVERQGVGYTMTEVLVSGAWRDGSIDVLDVAEAPTSNESPPVALPCPAPPGGWVSNEFGTGEQREAALARLDALVNGSPDVYSGRWTAYPSVGATAPSVVVVGTVEDAASVTPLLRRTFAGNLCVHSVDHSMADLQQIAQRLTKVDPASRVNIRLDLDMVEWELVAIDEKAAAALAVDRAAVLVRSLVNPE